MERSNNRVERIGIRYGLWVAAGLILFFLFMKLIGLVHNLELRFLNILILAAGVIAAIRELKNTSNKRYLSYMKGVGCGLITTGVGVILFAVFLVFYLGFIDTAFMAEIKQKEAFGDILNPVTVAITIIMEGGFSGVILTFATMQYMKFSLLKASREPRNDKRLDPLNPQIH
jgi:hypothetical protein